MVDLKLGKHGITLIVLATCTALSSNSFAISKLHMSQLDMTQSKAESLINQKSLFVLSTDKGTKPNRSKPTSNTAAYSGETVVLVDGVLMKINRWILESNIGLVALRIKSAFAGLIQRIVT